MSEWWTYSLRDLLLFSPRTYYRLFELHNAEWWPLPVFALALGLAMLFLLYRGEPRPLRWIMLVLALCWLWVAWAFLWQRYAAINPAASYFALAFMLQALLLLGLGTARQDMPAEPLPAPRRHAGLAILGYALLIHPLLGLLTGKSLSQAEVFGMAPDPTALGTLGILLLAKTKTFWLLAPIPLLWCLVSGATLWAMEAPCFWSLPLAALLVVGFATIMQTHTRAN